MGGLNIFAYAPNPVEWIDPLGLRRRGNAATKKHMDQVRDQVHADNPGILHDNGGRSATGGKELPELYLPPVNPCPNGSRKGGSYPDMTFTDAQDRTVHVQTVDKGAVNGMSQREWDNANRITQQNPNAIVVTVQKGNTPGALDTTNMTPGTVTIR